MSDTPMTDDLDIAFSRSDDLACALAMTDHARTLERALAAEKSSREKAEAELAENEGVIRVWRRRTEEAEAKVARLREALEDMFKGWLYIRRFHGDLYGVGWDRAEDKARAALKETADG